MGRRRRPFLPGAIFHLTARILRRERRFTPRLRTAAMAVIAEAMPRSGARLLALAIMSNHLHILVQQGEQPLSDLMQPVLRRLAALLQRAHGVDGPMFWRPYDSTPCLDPSHARNALVYTHLNPVRAGLCRDASGYPWTSHALYADPAATMPAELEPVARVLDPSLALPLFALDVDRSTEGMCGDYREFVLWRLAADRDCAGDTEEGDPRSGPRGDDGTPLAPPWRHLPGAASLSPLFHSPVRPGPRDRTDAPRPAAADLATVAKLALAVEAPGRSVESIRGRGGGREASRLRHVVIWRLHAAGYRNVDIARFLDLSESAVSYVLCRPRPGR